MTRCTPDMAKIAKKKILDLRSLLVSNRETETSKSNTPPTKKDRIDKAGHMPKSKPKIYFILLVKKNIVNRTSCSSKLATTHLTHKIRFQLLQHLPFLAQVTDHLALLQQHNAVAEIGDMVQVMAGDQKGGLGGFQLG